MYKIYNNKNKYNFWFNNLIKQVQKRWKCLSYRFSKSLNESKYNIAIEVFIIFLNMI